MKEFRIYPDTSIPMHVIVKGEAGDPNYSVRISSTVNDFLILPNMGQVMMELINVKLPINPITIFHRDSQIPKFKIDYEAAGENFFRYYPSSGTIIFPKGNYISVPRGGIIEGFADGNYLVMNPNRWQKFGDRIIKIKLSESDNAYPEFYLAIEDVLDVKAQVLDEELLNKLLMKYGSLERLISIYMEEEDQQLKELIDQALSAISPFSYDLLIASVRLPKEEVLKEIFNNNRSKPLEARNLSLNFACRVVVAAPEEREEIESLS